MTRWHVALTILRGTIKIVESLVRQIVITKDIRVELFLVTRGQCFPGWLLVLRVCVEVAAFGDGDACLV